MCLGIALAYWLKFQSLACVERNLKGEGMAGAQSEGGKEGKHECLRTKRAHRFGGAEWEEGLL